MVRHDQPFIFSLLDKALAIIGEKGFLKPVLFLTQFGQMDEDELDLFEVANPVEVDSLSLHVVLKVIAVGPPLQSAMSDVLSAEGKLNFL